MAPPPPPRAVLVVRNAACLCPMDDARRVVLDEGAVAVRGDRIVAVGTNAEVDAVLAGPEFQGAEVETIDAKNMLVLPGFIDAHCHAGHALVKTLGCGQYGAWGRACHQLYRCGPVSGHRARRARARAEEARTDTRLTAPPPPRTAPRARSAGTTEGFWEAEAELCALERLKVRRPGGLPAPPRRAARTADVRPRVTPASSA